MKGPHRMPTLVLILGDQLSPHLASLIAADKRDAIVLMCEVEDEANYVPHHMKKIAFILSAMRHFAVELERQGWHVDYVRLEDAGNTGSFTGEVERAVRRHSARRVIVTEPGEWRVLDMMRGWERALGVPVDILRDTRFICSREEFEAWADGRKQLRMEFFYREMRRKTGLLMDGDKPEGGQWNYDTENRKPAEASLFMPAVLRVSPDAITNEVLALIERRFGNHFGDLHPFWFAVTRADAERAFAHFLKVALPSFGTYQDAMLAGEKFLYHSVCSLYLNTGLLDPLELLSLIHI